MGTVVRGLGDGVPAGMAAGMAGGVATAATLVAPSDPDRVVPVVAPLGELLPAGGLVRGHVVACVGPAAPSVALALLARASAAGSWLAIVGLPWLAVEAAREAGVALERTVAVDLDPRRYEAWAEALMAAADGVELLLAGRDAGLPDHVLRRVRTRVRARGAVLVTLPAGVGRVGVDGRSAGGRTGEIDLTVSAHTEAWWGLGQGHGRVRGRRLHVEVAGRRVPRPVASRFDLPGGMPIG